MKKIFYLLTTLSFIIVNAQDPLPIWMTEEEKSMMSTYEFSTNSPDRNGITTPPQGNLRNMAEWEEVEYLLLTWVPTYSNTITNIVAAAVNECKVLIISSNPSSVENTLTNSGVALDSVIILERNYNTIWIRDYAANSVYQNWNDDLILVDWIYNRPRPLDNSSPEAVADELNIPLYQMTEAPTDLIGTGGNWMSDGFGTGFSSMLIVDENEPGNSFGVTGKSVADIENIFEDFMGIERYIKMDNLPYDAIDHIDMHMKLLDEETILVSEYPPGVADGPQIEANIQYVLDNYMSVYGTPYKTVRIPAPPSTSNLYPDNNGYYRTYTNSVFVNNTVIVPFYREEYDTIAQRIYGEALPGYNIVGVNVDGQNGEQLIAMGGAIHCITHSIGVQAPMILSHQALEDTYDNDNPYEVEAYISHRSGIANATLHYRVGNSGAYQSVPMTNTSGDDWVGYIPAQNGTVDIQYYVEGESNSGKTQVRPMPAPDGYWEFTVFDDELANLNEDGIEVKAIYPNPATSITVVPVVSAPQEKGKIELLDITGKVVEVIYEGEFPLGEKNYFFDASNYAKGSYRVNITSNRRSESHQIVIL
jgi:agmatine/peptidylarginine deiminase